MNDTIYRQAAIDAFWKIENEMRPSAIDAVINMLKTLPSAQSERKKGRWIGACCSNCRLSRYNWQREPFGTWNFCPNCGADMRKEGDDE